MTETEADAVRGLVSVRAGGEREVLEAFLDFHRAVLVRKVRGVAEDEARRRRLPSMTTLAGLLRHMTVVERNWFQRIVARRPVEIPGLASGATEASWRLEDQDTVPVLISEYEEACAISREIAGRLPLAYVVPHEGLGEVSLRWIYVHMIEETARHAGHADILRELADGRVGVTG